MEASDALAVRNTVHQFLSASQNGNIDLLKKLAALLDDGRNGMSKTISDVKDGNERGAFHFAAGEGRVEMCKYLLEDLKLDVNVRDAEGETPLIHAARRGHFDTAIYLIEHGANPMISSDMGATALHHSAGHGNVELLCFLLSRGMIPDLESDAGTPLLWAAGNGEKDAVKILLEHHANPNAETDDNVTPLLSAVAACSLPCLDLLIQAGANVNVIAGGTTPLHIAADNGNQDILLCLLNAGADPNIVDEDGQKPIQAAAVRGNREAVEILLPVTSVVKNVSHWTVDGIIEFMQIESFEKEGGDKVEETQKQNGIIKEKQDHLEVSSESKKKAMDAKLRGDEAFKNKDYLLAIDAYTQAIDLDGSDAAFFSNRSLCWGRTGQADRALADARKCRTLRPEWAKACYREGSALRLLQLFDQAASAFYEGVKLDPENMELVSAFREAVEAGRMHHSSTDVQKM